jgi:predicted ABC-type ATPase
MKFHLKKGGLIIICDFTRKLYKFVNLIDSVFDELKLCNKFNIWNLSGWNNFMESWDVYVLDGISPMSF